MRMGRTTLTWPATTAPKLPESEAWLHELLTDSADWNQKKPLLSLQTSSCQSGVKITWIVMIKSRSSLLIWIMKVQFSCLELICKHFQFLFSFQLPLGSSLVTKPLAGRRPWGRGGSFFSFPGFYHTSHGRTGRFRRLGTLSGNLRDHLVM